MANIEENIIINRIIGKINKIGEEQTVNKAFVANVKEEVINLNNIVIELLGKLNNHIVSLDEKITQFESNKKQIEELQQEKDKLLSLVYELKNQISSGTEAENTSAQQNKNLTEQINSLTKKEKDLQEQIDQLTVENTALKKQLNNMNIELGLIEDALKGLDSKLITQNELQEVLDIIKQIKDAIYTFTKSKEKYLTGGRQKRGRKFVTRKMKKGVKKGMMMRGGYIAYYKPKTHRRRKDKKRSSSMRRGKKQQYTTSTSRLTTTSSY